MEFSVNFQCSIGYPIDIQLEYLGLKHLDFIRNELGIKLDPERVCSQISSIRADVQIELDEEIARESKHFDDTCHIVVKCENGQLNDFVINEVSTNVVDNTGEIKYASLKRTIDSKAILSFWKEKNYSLDLSE